MAILETDRLVLRKFTEADAPFLLELMNAPGWIRFIGDLQIDTVEAAQRHIARKLMPPYSEHGFGLYLVIDREASIPIGMCGLVKREGLDDVDIGFAFLPEHGSRGYAYESASAVIAHARELHGLRRLVAITTEDNTRSIRLLEKLEFAREGTVRLPAGDEELVLYARET